MFRVFRSMFSAPLRMSCFTMLMCLFLLSSCRDSATLHRLEAVEAVIDANPELAWYMLDSIDGTVLRGEARALHALLSTQADYQCYVPLTSDSLILIAACYYGAGRPNYRAAMSRYYLGCTYTELGRDADAIRAYMQAIPLFPDTTVRQRALCYQNMARHYRNRNMFAESLDAFRAFRASMLLRGKPATRRPSSFTRRCWVRVSPIAQYSPLLPPVGVWAISQSQCGRSSSQTGY